MIDSNNTAKQQPQLRAWTTKEGNLVLGPDVTLEEAHWLRAKWQKERPSKVEAAKPSDREWQRLRRVEAKAKRLLGCWGDAPASEDVTYALEELRFAIWPGQGEE
jgi:hypothetical protein